MKIINYKKIIVGIFSFVLLFTATQSAFASTTWNGASNDCKGISILNASTNVGYAYPCWPLSTVTLDPGDTINVRIYYHNTGSETAKNTRVTLSAQTDGSASSSKTFSASISSDQGGKSLGSVTANLTSAQTITFNSVKWYTNNKSETLTPLLGSGSDILAGGLNIGDIAPGWATQGSLVISFHVSTGTTPTPTSSCSISSFSASPTSVSSGDRSTLSWSTTSGCDHVTLTGLSGTQNANGSAGVFPVVDTTYTLRAFDSNGNLSDSDTVTVAVNDNNNNNYCSIVNFTANGSTYNATIYQGDSLRDSLRLVWDTTGCSTVSVTGPNFTSSAMNDNRIIYPQISGNYTINAFGSGYNNSKTQTIFVTVNHITVNPVYNPPVYVPPVQTNACTVTTVATNVTATSAQINGLISNYSNNSYLNTHFEYGTSVSLGSPTIIRTMNSNGSFNEYITGLAPNTYYYFRAFSNCPNGQLGNFETFKTLGTGNTYTGSTTTRTVIVQGKTVVGTESPIVLHIEDRYQAIGVGDTIDYTVYYKNIGSSTLTNPVLQVVIPKGITLTNASQGTFDNDTNTLSIPLPVLIPGAEGTIFLQGHVDSINSGYAQIVTTAILVYTSPNGAQENAIAYALNNPKLVNGSVLGASAFFGNFLGLGLVGWLIIIILIMLIILIARSYSNRTTSTTTHTYTDNGGSHM